MQEQKKQLIVLTVLVVGLIVYLSFTFIPRESSSSSDTLSPRLDPNSPMFRGEESTEL